jgi:hypothetical protein
MLRRQIGKHHIHRGAGRHDAEVSEWLAEVMSIIDDIAGHADPSNRPRRNDSEPVPGDTGLGV